ncbi:probable phytol kinase 3, chloroplastic isoform X2 [Tripterygium wilfordii]|uniref:probable phytol kinase 3, chloroplastic isoform X2 n=1 Tax=Tripterygium wilfordii TaxID=458696 RepID=UPI0018F83E4A|nr:probable phytol kinase 3, chloroplastic isoform X2 [Tripterygium wilfordii]
MSITVFVTPIPLLRFDPSNAKRTSSSIFVRPGVCVKGGIRRSSRLESSSHLPAAMLVDNRPVLSDLCASGLAGGIALCCLKLWQETAKRSLFDQKLNRKLVHISIGLVFMLCWPLFSAGRRGAMLAALTPGINIFRMLFLGLGIYKDEGTVKSMTRFGDHRELLKGPLYYATTITLACIICWRTSPIAIAAICNLCAGDGLADVIGRRFGNLKLPYNRNKSIAGSITMALSGFLTSVGIWIFGEKLGNGVGFLDCVHCLCPGGITPYKYRP